jgi:hypothetical protein
MIMWASTRWVLHNNLIDMASQMLDRDEEALWQQPQQIAKK